MTTLKRIETSQAPTPKGPYSQAVKAGSFLFVSGQIPINPLTNEVVENTIEAQTTQVLDNIEAVLQAEGLFFKNVVKVEVYLKDMNDFQEMNKLYAQRFSFSIQPARQTLQVAKLPLDVLLEISCIAYYE